jgi:hypothetical protein
MTSNVAASGSACAAAPSPFASADGPLVDLAAIEAELLAHAHEVCATRERSFSVCEAGGDAASSASAIFARTIVSFENPKPQIKRLREVFYGCCKKESFEVLSDIIERIEGHSIDSWASSREMIMHNLLAHALILSEDELDKIDKALLSDLKTFSIVNLREIPIKIRLYKSCIAEGMFPKELFFENPRHAQAIAIDFTLKTKQWDLFSAFCADASSDLVNPILDAFFETISLDATISSKFLLDIKRVGGVLSKRYKLQGFEKQLLDWIELTSNF